MIVTTYNRPDMLTLVLQSALVQTRRDFEIIIADDGSGPETAEAAKTVLERVSIPWKHVRHPDDGIRQARIKNLAVKHARGEYLIFIDHDVLLHPAFIEDHVRIARSGRFLVGKRVFISPRRTAMILGGHPFRPPGFWEPGLENRKNALRLPRPGRWIGRPRTFQTFLRGSNFSLFRDDFLSVDGYDETFDGLWGREDSDIAYRLFHAGKTAVNLWFSALQYHLHHPSIKRNKKDRLDRELEIIIQTNRSFALTGYSKLGAEGGVVHESP